MSQEHKVKPGDHLSSIAEQYGFRDFQTIWDDAGNEPLRAAREEPHVLYPGDQVFIPDKRRRVESRPTGDTHPFKVLSRPLKLRIALKDFDNEPIVGVQCELVIEGRRIEIVSDGEGMIETPIPRSARSGMLRIPELDIEHPVKIGHLDPIDESPGWQGRLVNLGYHGGSVGDDDEAQWRHAIEEFQCDHKLAVTGELDAGTHAKLKQQHGS